MYVFLKWHFVLAKIKKKNWPRHNLDNYIYKGTSRTDFFDIPSLQVPFKLQRIEVNCHAFSRDVPESCKSPTLVTGRITTIPLAALISTS